MLKRITRHARSQNSWNFLQNYLIGYLIYSASNFCENDFQLVFSLPKTINRFLGCYATRVTLHCCDGSAFVHSRLHYTWIRNNEPHANLFRPRFEQSFRWCDIHVDCQRYMYEVLKCLVMWVNIPCPNLLYLLDSINIQIVECLQMSEWLGSVGRVSKDVYPYIYMNIVRRTLPELSSVAWGVLSFLLKKKKIFHC